MNDFLKNENLTWACCFLGEWADLDILGEFIQNNPAH